MRSTIFLPALLIGTLLGIGLMGCAAHQGSSPAVQMSQPLLAEKVTPQSTFTLHTQGCPNYDADGLGMTLTAFLQSDANMLIANSDKAADYVINVHVSKVGLTDKQAASLALNDVAMPLVIGTLGGTAVGGSIGSNSGAAWGAGIGALLGLTFGVATHEDVMEYVWTMLADVTVTHDKKTSSSRMVVTTSSEDADLQQALPLLENELAQSIARSFAEGQ